MDGQRDGGDEHRAAPAVRCRSTAREAARRSRAPSATARPRPPGRSRSRCARRRRRMKRAQIIGVTVSDTTVDTTIAKASVSENSRNRRPTMPPMNRSGMKAAISDRLIEMTVKPICRAPSSAAPQRRSSRPRGCGGRSRSSRSRRRPRSRPRSRAPSATGCRARSPPAHIAAQVPASDSGTVTPAASVGVSAAQEHEHHQHHQRDGGRERPLHVAHAGADGDGAVGQDVDLDARPGSSA